MKPYGLPRTKDIQWPDVGDIQQYALASHVGKFKEKGGVFKSYIRNAQHRRSTRRHWKHIERMQVKNHIRCELNIQYL